MNVIMTAPITFGYVWKYIHTYINIIESTWINFNTYIYYLCLRHLYFNNNYDILFLWMWYQNSTISRQICSVILILIICFKLFLQKVWSGWSREYMGWEWKYTHTFLKGSIKFTFANRSGKLVRVCIYCDFSFCATDWCHCLDPLLGHLLSPGIRMDW